MLLLEGKRRLGEEAELWLSAVEVRELRATSPQTTVTIFTRITMQNTHNTAIAIVLPNTDTLRPMDRLVIQSVYKVLIKKIY